MYRLSTRRHGLNPAQPPMAAAARACGILLFFSQLLNVVGQNSTI
jgi:hypothetical protein